jgi:hypothetical protein
MTRRGISLESPFQNSASVTELSQHEADGGKFQEREGVAVKLQNCAACVTFLPRSLTKRDEI